MELPFVLDDSSLPPTISLNKQFRYLVKNTPLVFKIKVVSELRIVVLNSNKEDVSKIGTLSYTLDGLEIRLNKLSKGNSFFIVRIHDHNTLLFEIYVKSITKRKAAKICKKMNIV